jgi:hypothetical protein
MDLNNTEKITQIASTINDMFIKYKDSPYMTSRLETHLLNLPNMLDQENKRYDERVSRFNELTFEQDNFHKVFLSKHQYFYMPYNNIYYEYDGKTYRIVKDDDIHHHLLSTITDEGKLIQWKHKTKQTIVKRIKERSLLKSIPETYTIQNVLGFLQTVFQTKTEAKYFLTIIGDCLLKKNTDNLLYFVSSNTKKLITMIDSIGYVTTGNSIMSNFITKYHDSHKISSYRLIKTNEGSNALAYDIVKNVLNNIGIDLLCVASHYSEQYTNSENYLKTKADDVIKDYVLYFVDKQLENIVDGFIEQCIENVSSETSISWKNMHYIWKLYLTSVNIPNMVYSTQLQTILAGKIENVLENGNITFKNVTSKYLPNVSSFLSFWEKYIVITGDNSLDDEYEIDEFVTLYKNSDQKNSDQKNSDQKNSQISDINMIKMICHYFSPQVEVIDNKYITNIKCNLWNKQDDINDFLNSYKSNVFIAGINPNSELISFDELYQGYKLYFKAKGVIEQKILPIVSKQFFEKFLTNQLQTYIKFEKFVSSEWLQV